MIAVIHDDIDNRCDPVKGYSLDSFGFQFSGVGRRDGINGTHVIIHDTAFHAFSDFLFQYFKHGIEHFSFFNDEVFHENIVLCFLHFFQHDLPSDIS